MSHPFPYNLIYVSLLTLAGVIFFSQFGMPFLGVFIGISGYRVFSYFLPPPGD